MKTPCSVCQSPLRDRVNDMIAESVADLAIAEFSVAKALPLTRQAIGRHRRSGHAINEILADKAPDTIAAGIVKAYQEGDSRISPHQALRAEAQLRGYAEKEADETILAKLVQALAGHVERPTYQAFPGDEEAATDEDDFAARRLAYEERMSRVAPGVTVP